MVEVAIFNHRQHEQFTSSTGKFVLRQANAIPELWTFAQQASLDDFPDGIQFTVSSAGVMIDASRTSAVVYSVDGTTAPNDAPIALPCVLQLGSTWLEIALRSSPRNLVPLLPTELINFAEDHLFGDDHCNGPSSETITNWLSATGQLHRAAANSPQFFSDAARFAVETVGLDAAWVLKRSDKQCQAQCKKPCAKEWNIVGSLMTSPADGVRFDSTVLEQIRSQKVAWYQPAPNQETPDNEFTSVSGFHQAVVIAPVLDSRGQLIAAVYGVRNTTGENRRLGIRPLEARLIQLLAESVGVGISRLEQETEAARTRILLEQAFSPTVADYIQQHPDCLLGQQRELTLLFVDLREYTTIAETLSPADCYALLGDVMESLTEVVMHNGGVVVDYYGDGLLAIWNAPLDQPNHPDLACSAAMQMFDELPSATQKWESILNRPLEIGIGIHTGPAHVGNAGTRSCIKYGPRGNTVNVASRVQAASKQLELPLVITAETQTKLTNKFFTLRACTARLPGLVQPTELFTAYPASEARQVKSRLDQYTHALKLFEAGDLEEAEQLLSKLVALGQVTPAKFLAHYTAAQKNGNHSRRAVDRYAATHSSVIEILGK